MNVSDVRKLKKLASRLGVRDSDVIRFAVKSMLTRLGPLYDAEMRGRALVPVFVEFGTELLRFFDLDGARLEAIVNEGVDCAVRVGDLPDSSLVSVRLAENRRMCVATPAYVARAGTPRHPGELSRHECLTLSSDASQTRGWAFLVDGGVTHLRPSGRLDCGDGQVLHDWCLAGMGIAWRSTWEVEQEVAAGLLASVLDDFAAPPNGIYAVFPHAKHLPLRVRLWIDFLKHSYGDSAYWKRAPALK